MLQVILQVKNVVFNLEKASKCLLITINSNKTIRRLSYAWPDNFQNFCANICRIIDTPAPREPFYQYQTMILIQSLFFAWIWNFP